MRRCVVIDKNLIRIKVAQGIVDLAREDFPEKKCRDREVSLPTSSCNRSRSKPSAQSRSRAGNSGANGHLPPLTDQNIFPNRDVLPPEAGRRNKFPPTWPRRNYLDGRGACRGGIHRQRSTRGRVSHYRSPGEAASLGLSSVSL